MSETEGKEMESRGVQMHPERRKIRHGNPL